MQIFAGICSIKGRGGLNLYNRPMQEPACSLTQKIAKFKPGLQYGPGYNYPKIREPRTELDERCPIGPKTGPQIARPGEGNLSDSKRK